MNHNFLLDENVVNRAFRGGPALRIWAGIARNCHRLILSSVLEQKYRAKVRLLRNRHNIDEEVAYQATRLINLVLHDSAKSVYVVPRVLEDRERVIHHRNDWFLEDIAVEFATSTGYRVHGDTCLFVSTDRRTREGFNHANLRVLGFSGNTIEQAAVAADEPCVEEET